MLTETAKQADERIQSMYAALGFAWVGLAVECLKFKDANHWKTLGFESFDSWASDRFIKSRSIVRARMRVVEQLEVGIPLCELAKITVQNCEALLKVPEPKRYQPDMIEMAKSYTEKRFLEAVKLIPGNATPYDEAMETVSFRVPASLARRIESCLKFAMVIEETESRIVAVEAIFTHYLTDFEGRTSNQ